MQQAPAPEESAVEESAVEESAPEKSLPGDSTPSFADLGLAPPVLRAVDEVGYEAPSTIQARAIPPLLAGRDLLGQAQTGTGKTAAFSLPLLSRLDLENRQIQILVLTPTRELAIQVAEVMKTYARFLRGFHVVPIYGGQSFGVQLRQLRRGVHVVVGTPGRIQDHLRRATLDLSGLTTVVLDEADEMLRMGFQEDVENILEHTPKEKQVALFSATMAKGIREVARKHLRNPVELESEARTATVSTVSQHYWRVVGTNKLDALTRILEVEDFDAMLVFVRTKVATAELSQRLEARGFACAPLNGDMNQALRERTVERFKNGDLDIVVATDVAARGLDVERVSHVVNFDVPYDVEAYVHRIGRTARAGRRGKAILFVANRERRMLQTIERVTQKRIEKMELPSRQDVAARRVEQFKETVTEALDGQDLSFYEKVVLKLQEEREEELSRIAAALAYLAQRERPLLLPHESKPSPAPRAERTFQPESSYTPRPERDRQSAPGQAPSRPAPSRPAPHTAAPPTDEGMKRYRIEVGKDHGVAPGNIVGAISNEAGLDGKYIGQIRIFEDFSLVDLPGGMPQEIFRHLKNVQVFGQKLRIRLDDGPPGAAFPATASRPSSVREPKGPAKDRKKTKNKSPRIRDRKAKGKPKGKKGAARKKTGS